MLGMGMGGGGAWNSKGTNVTSDSLTVLISRADRDLPIFLPFQKDQDQSIHRIPFDLLPLGLSYFRTKDLQIMAC